MPAQSTTYWNSMDFESEDYSDYSNSSLKHSSRKYVDPWDLENYAYMRKHLESSTPDPTTPSLAGEPTDSTFYYIPGTEGEPTYDLNSFFYPTETVYGTAARYAGIDEANFRNDQIIYNNNEYVSKGQYVTSKNIQNVEDIYGQKLAQLQESVTEIESSTDGEDESSPQLSDEPLVYVYERSNRRRSLVVPNNVENMTFVRRPRRHSMAIPNTPFSKTFKKYGSEKADYVRKPLHAKLARPHSICDHHNQYLDCLQPANMESYPNIVELNHYEAQKQYLDEYYKTMLMPVPIYDETMMVERRKPDNFSLSNYGHLKIDYSFSWNTLDRFIKK